MPQTSRYVGAADFRHDRIGEAAVVLVNLGTPDAPATPAVRRYLAEFLADPRVIELPRWLWRPILHGVILRIRPRRSAQAYAKIWTDQGSPLLVNSRAIATALGAELARRRPGPVTVRLAMRYGAPNLRDVLAELARAGTRRVLLVPLYPQYSATSTGSVIDAFADTLKTLRWPPEARIVNDYFTEPGYIAALAAQVEAHWRTQGRADRLLLSFHGIPQRYFLAGDPYFCHCQATARRLRERLGLAAHEVIVSFQSRVGREEWLKPYTDETLKALPVEGVRSLQVFCPGFAADCLETLEEIAMQNRNLFLAAGGERYEYIPALNALPAHIDALADLVLRHAQGWPEFTPDWSAETALAAAAAVDARHQDLAYDDR